MALLLTEQQREAVEYGGRNLEIIACAGTGKTEVLAQRVAHLLTRSDGRLRPENIVAFTFTNKAAAELRSRIHQRVGGSVLGMAGLFVGTIHSFCLELLTSEVPEFLKFETLAEARLRMYIRRHGGRTGFDDFRQLNGEVPWERFRLQNYLTALARMRESEVTDLRILEPTSAYQSLLRFQAALFEDAYLDYGEQVRRAVRVIADDPAVRDRLSNRIHHLLVDEYQDVDPAQERLISLIHSGGAGLSVVGDDDQTIYQWRGTHLRNMIEFSSRYPDVRQVRLEDNRRSSRTIVSLASSIVAGLTDRLDKEMACAGVQGSEPGDVTMVEFDNPEDEADYIAETIRALHGLRFDDGFGERGLTYSDMAVLVRVNSHPAGHIRAALDEVGVGSVGAGDDALFDTVEGRAALDLLLYVSGADLLDPDDSVFKISREDLEGSWSDPVFGVSPQALDDAMSFAEGSRTNTAGSGSQGETIQGIYRGFVSRLCLEESRMPKRTFDRTMYLLGAFSKCIGDWEAIYHDVPVRESMCGFIEFVLDGTAGGVGDLVTENPVEDGDAVTITTIHKAKGREWPVVFVPALTDGFFPTVRRRDWVWESVPKSAIADAGRYDYDLENEDRLFYVAVTRSQKFLHLTKAPGFDYYGNELRHPSKYWLDSSRVLGGQTAPPDYASRDRAPAESRRTVKDVEISFTDLKSLLECPYQYRLAVLYGFTSPLVGGMGFGKGLHDALYEVHSLSEQGGPANDVDVGALVGRHLLLRYADERKKREMTEKAIEIVTNYINDNLDELPHVRLAEQPVLVHFDGGITVKGRIDLVRRSDDGTVTIVDLKSTSRAQAEDVTLTQLHTYVLGYRELTGENADFVEIYELDERCRDRRPVNDQLLNDIRDRTLEAVDRLRRLDLRPDPEEQKCGRCEVQDLCPASLAR